MYLSRLSKFWGPPNSIVAFTVKPAQKESAFVKLPGVELELVLSARQQNLRFFGFATFANLP